MDQIIDNLNFEGLESLWNATYPEFQMYEYLDDIDFDNDDDLFNDIKSILRSYREPPHVNDLMMLAFLSKLVEFIDPEIPYVYYHADEVDLKNVDFNVNAYEFMKYYEKELRSFEEKKSKKGTIPDDFMEGLNQLRAYTLKRFGILIRFK